MRAQQLNAARTAAAKGKKKGGHLHIQRKNTQSLRKHSLVNCHCFFSEPAYIKINA